MKTIDEIAKEENLIVVDTFNFTEKGHRAQEALIGFDSWEQVKRISENYGLQITDLRKSDGEDAWHDEGKAYEPYTIGADDYGDDYTDESCQTEEQVVDDYKNLEEGLEKVDEILNLWKRAAFMLEKIDEAGDDYIVLCCNGQFVDLVEKRPLRWNIDTKSAAIGLLYE